MDYSIKNTTREERIKLVKKAIGISISDCDMPEDEDLRIMKQYIDGKKELKEVQDEIIARHNDNKE